MTVHLCKDCGFQLYPSTAICPWCKTPVKKITALHYSIFAFLVLPGLYFVVANFSSFDFARIFSLPEPPHNPALNQVKEPQSLIAPEIKLAKFYVKGDSVNLREHPSMESPTIAKLKMGQQLTQIAHSGDWAQVLVDENEDKRGWVHASLVRKFDPDQSPRASNLPNDYVAFLDFFEEYNHKIKMRRGTTLFKNVEYKDNGIIEVTATDNFLATSEIYKQLFMDRISQKWLAVRDIGLPAVVRIVDAHGIVQWENRLD
jgi:hypothetical protein